VTASLNTIVKNFIWKGARVPPINKETLCADTAQGGLKLLDILTRNQAIQLTWVRSYLTLGNARPTWAYVADELIAKHVSSAGGKIQSLAQMNCFLQTWQ
ncbi:hypothetical protein OBBRIDRAFT_699685, partial [Obba rivulosa]